MSSMGFKMASAILVVAASTLFTYSSAVAVSNVTINDPTTGTLLGTQTISMNGSSDFTPTQDPLNAVSGCGIVANTAHPYTLLPFTVSVSGDYTFRVISTNPGLPDGVDSNPYSYGPWSTAFPPTGDLMMALYDSNINLATDPDEGVIGCNDDPADWDTEYNNAYDNVNNVGPAIYSQSGQHLSIKNPEFIVNNLAAGDYTILLTTWSSGFDSSSWTADGWGTQTAQFEFWGPTGGITSGIVQSNVGTTTSAQAELATTGTQTPNTVVSVSILLLTGFAMLLASNSAKIRNSFRLMLKKTD